MPGHDWEWQIEAQANGARPAQRRRSRCACGSALPRLAGRVRRHHNQLSFSDAASQRRWTTWCWGETPQRRQCPLATRLRAPTRCGCARRRAATPASMRADKAPSRAAACGRRWPPCADAAVAGEAYADTPRNGAGDAGSAVLRRANKATPADAGRRRCATLVEGLLACALVPQPASVAPDGPPSPRWVADAACRGVARLTPRAMHYSAHSCTCVFCSHNRFVSRACPAPAAWRGGCGSARRQVAARAAAACDVPRLSASRLSPT